VVLLEEESVVWLNQTALQMLRLGDSSAAHDVTKPHVSTWPLSEVDRSQLRALIRYGSGQAEITVVGGPADGMTFLVDASSPPEGYPGAVLLTLANITDLKREHDALEKASEVIELRLEQELQRKQEELERARSLQLSMLPPSLPEIRGFEMAARMRTASEVGGDYYDVAWHDDEQGMLVIGDATGHGLDAGMMVTATKSTLAMIPAEYAPGELLTHLNTSLRRLALPRMYMSLASVQTNEEGITLSGAGMPPAYLWRAATAVVETITMKSPPLAGFAWFDFPVETRRLESGDTLLLMTDGFPERFNRDREMMGFHAAGELLGQYGNRPLVELLDILVKASDEWAAGLPHHDDETFLIVRRR
jgi:serine phosphatase RsbU (regulator of sigma subunit)